FVSSPFLPLCLLFSPLLVSSPPLFSVNNVVSHCAAAWRADRSGAAESRRAWRCGDAFSSAHIRRSGSAETLHRDVTEAKDVRRHHVSARLLRGAPSPAACLTAFTTAPRTGWRSEPCVSLLKPWN
ncbi:hypothetical protein LDENG_00053210, partial [Lucifuga dentata]